MAGRKRRRRKLNKDYAEYIYKAIGVSDAGKEEVEISDEELETLRLQFIEEMEQRTAAESMGISQSQFQRDLVIAIKKITQAFISGDSINIKKYENINRK